MSVKTQRIPMIAAVIATEQLIALDCANCGVIFAVPTRFNAERREDGRTFFCPNGHSLTYGKTALDTAKEQLAEAERMRDMQGQLLAGEERRHEVTKRQLAARKGQVTKMKNRAAAGLCPCCNRHFENLARHMTGQHPDYANGADHE